MAADTKDHDLTRVHERLDDLFAGQAEVKAALVKIAEGCGPCRALVQKHEDAIYGNGKKGILTILDTASETVKRLDAADRERVDTVTVKSVVVLVGSIGALAATIGGAMAALVK